MSLALSVVTPEGPVFEGEVERVVLPGAEGDFGVLEEHERFLAALRPGAVEIRTDGNSQWAAVSDGFADVGGRSVVVLVGRCDLASEIDREASEQELAQARAQCDALGDDEASARERAQLELAMAAAEARIEVAARA